MKLEVVNGKFSYKDKKILKDINFSLDKGEILGILGPNGIGKTTLIKCLTGLMDWTSGKSLLDGVDIKEIREKDLWKKISYVPQKRSFTFSYTGLEMVVMGRSVNLSLFERVSEKDIGYAKKIMEEIGISHLENEDCNLMSGGELQMILIARALVSDPSLIILDEPETGLDFKNQLIVLNLLKKLSKEKEISVILNTHYPENALRLSDKCLLMYKDYDYDFGDSKEILTEENIKRAFEVDVLFSKVKKDGKTYKSIIPTNLTKREV